MCLVTKVDERARVPPLDEAARDRLAAALDSEGVVAAALFGSQARGDAGPLSDIDVGVWVDPALTPTERFELVLDLSAAAARALGTDEADLVSLNDAPPLLGHRALREGTRLIDRDPRTRATSRPPHSGSPTRAGRPSWPNLDTTVLSLALARCRGLRSTRRRRPRGGRRECCAT
jgi:predicted nucleotidyltransferase